MSIYNDKENSYSSFLAKSIIDRQVANTKPLGLYKKSYYNIFVKLKSGEYLIFNSTTRALSLINEQEHKIFNNFDDEIKHDGKDFFISSLVKDGFLVPIGVDEIMQTRSTYDAVKNDKDSLMLTIAPTMGCNLACGYCFQGLDKDLNKMTQDVLDGIYDLAYEYAIKGIKRLEICWYGGEPLMGRNEIYWLSDKLIELCTKFKINYNASIVTNGYFLDIATANALVERGCGFAQVTIDGGEETHDKQRPLTSGKGSFRRIVDNVVDVTNSTNMYISSRINVGKENIDECENLLDVLVNYGLSHNPRFSINFAPITASTVESGTSFDEAMTNKEFNQRILVLEEKAVEMGLSNYKAAPMGIMGMCVAAKEQGYLISPNGDLHNCWETAHDTKKRIGSIFELKEHKKNVNTMLWDNWRPTDNEICRACKIAPMCGGMCGHRFIYSLDNDESSLPCPDWKWNTNEYIFRRALAKGFVTKDLWDENQSTIDLENSGKRHTVESIENARKIVITKVNKNLSDLQIDEKFPTTADGRFFENVR